MSKTKLGDIADILMGQSPVGKDCNTEGTGIPLLNGPTEFGAYHPHPLQFTTGSKKLASEGDILFCVRGSTTGRMNYADQTYSIGRGIASIKGKNNYPTTFVRAVLECNLNSMLQIATGSTFPNLGKDALNNFELELVSSKEAQKISPLIEQLEQKILNNTLMNATLEKIAQRIFKSWFVDFDPVKANAEGVPFDGLSPKIQSLFPNEFEESELGMIPKGWEVKSLDEIAHFLNGLACQKHRPKDGETPLPVIKIAEMRAGYQEKTNEASPNVDPKYIIQDGDFLFSWSGSLTTCFWSHGPGVLNQHLFKVTSEDYPKWFFSMWVNVHLAEFIRIAADKATTMGHIKREHLSQAKVVVPNLEDLMTKGNDIFGPLIERSNLCLTQAKTLMKVRDKLLPRLISGKITIQKAEELLEEAS